MAEYPESAAHGQRHRDLSCAWPRSSFRRSPRRSELEINGVDDMLYIINLQSTGDGRLSINVVGPGVNIDQAQVNAESVLPSPVYASPEDVQRLARQQGLARSDDGRT